MIESNGPDSRKSKRTASPPTGLISMLIGSHLPLTPRIDRGKYRYLDGPCSGSVMGLARASSEWYAYPSDIQAIAASRSMTNSVKRPCRVPGHDGGRCRSGLGGFIGQQGAASARR